MKMPKLEFGEEGDCNLIVSNGWELIIANSIITLLNYTGNDSDGAELAIIITQIGCNEGLSSKPVHVILAMTFCNIIHETVDDVSDSLTDMVGEALVKIEEGFK